MVRCADCGLLCYKNQATRTFEHVDAEARKTAQFPTYKLGGGNIRFRYDPYCLVLACDLAKELKARTPPSDAGGNFQSPIEAVLEVIGEQRECSSWVKWRPGFSPKEHMEMQLLDEQRKWEQEQRERDRRWQEEMRKEDLKWKVDQEKLAEARWIKEHRLQRHQLVIVGIVGTLILAIAQIVSAILSAK